MAITLISSESRPAYLALSSDFDSAGSGIVGASLIGKTVYVYDTKKWFIITGSLTGSACRIYPLVEPKLET